MYLRTKPLGMSSLDLHLIKWLFNCTIQSLGMWNITNMYLDFSITTEHKRKLLSTCCECVCVQWWWKNLSRVMFLIVIRPIWLYVHYIVIVMHVLCWSAPNLFPTRIDGTAVSCPNSRWWDNSVSPQFLHLQLFPLGIVTLWAQTPGTYYKCFTEKLYLQTAHGKKDHAPCANRQEDR
jgi:hypothetical protein